MCVYECGTDPFLDGCPMNQWLDLIKDLGVIQVIVANLSALSVVLTRSAFAVARPPSFPTKLNCRLSIVRELLAPKKKRPLR
jgi:hypothetical protein